MTTDRAALLAAVDRVGPVVEAERAEGDRLGALTDRALAALADNGLLRMKLPAEVGGTDANPLTQFAVLERLACADGAAAWNAMAIGTAGAFAASRLPLAGIAAVAGGGSWPVFAGTFPHSGRAMREPGGWRLRGRWGFASGIRNATWVACAAVVDGADTQRLCFALPRDDVVVEDTWHADGLRATGSTHYHVDAVHVPDERTFRLEGEPQRGGPMHRLPTLAYLLGDHSAVALGLARRALIEVAAQSRGRVRLGAVTSTADRGMFQHELGRHDLALRAARALLVEEMTALWETARAGDVVTAAMTARARAAAAHAASCVTGAVVFAHRMSGAGGVLDHGPRHRAVMDALTATQHVYFDDQVIDVWGSRLGAAGEGCNP